MGGLNNGRGRKEFCFKLKLDSIQIGKGTLLAAWLKCHLDKSGPRESSSKLLVSESGRCLLLPQLPGPKQGAVRLCGKLGFPQLLSKGTGQAAFTAPFAPTRISLLKFL